MATIFDENAALMVVRDCLGGKILIAALMEHQWHEALIEQSPTFWLNTQV
ncbi:MAG: hypothetical protein H7240_03825 [Glaciimonas sp.]|nr:hypothetical protein [Glaciimonas sp.]